MIKNYKINQKHIIVSHFEQNKVIVLFCRGGFYKNEMILNKEILELFPNLNREAFFVFDTFGLEPQIITYCFLTNIVLFPINKSISNTLNIKMITEGILTLKFMKEFMGKNYEDFIFIIPKKWLSLKQILKTKGWEKWICI